MNTLEFKHTLNNKLLVIQNLLKHLHENLPLLTTTYAVAPIHARTGDISDYVLDALPKMVEHGLAAVQQMQIAVHDLEEPHHG